MRRDVLSSWVLARAAVALGLVVAVVAADELRPGDRPIQTDQGLFAWDAAFYRDIADYGYGGVAQEGLRFFPLLPIASRVLSFLFLGNVGVALLVLVNVAALAAGYLLQRLALRETGDDGVARRSAWFLALIPPAAVLVLGYAEAILLVVTIGAFLALRRDRWRTAAALGLLAGLVRPTGVLLALPALVEAVRNGRGLAPRALLARLAAVVAPVVGTFVYLWWAEREHGDWLLPIRLQNTEELRGGWANPVSTVIDALSGDGLGEALHVPWIAAFAVLLVVVFRKLPVSYGLYSATLLVMALSGQTLGSFERYGLAAFPLLIALAIVTAPPLVERVALTACGAALTGYTTLIFLGAFVP